MFKVPMLCCQRECDRDKPLVLGTNSIFSSSGKKLEVETIHVLNDLQVLMDSVWSLL